MDRHSKNPMLAHEEPDELDMVEVRKEEKPMGICKVEGCGKKVLARGLCPKHYMAERDRLKKEGTWNPIPQAGWSKPKPETTGPEPEVTQIATPQTETPATETKGPGLQILPHKGKLYLLAEIRVMTEEQLREMFGG